MASELRLPPSSLALLLAVAACTGGGPAPSGGALVEHLEPVSALDGRPSVLRLSNGREPVRLELGPESDGLELAGAKLATGAAPLTLEGTTSGSPFGLSLEGLRLDCNGVTRVEVVGRAGATPKAHLRFQSSARERGREQRKSLGLRELAQGAVEEVGLSATAAVHGANASWSFDVSTHPGWSGTLSGLQLDFIGGERVALEAILLHRPSWNLGPSPRGGPESPRDAGLLDLARMGGEARTLRRATPALAGEDLLVRPTAPGRPRPRRLHLSAALASGPRSSPVSFELLTGEAEELPLGSVRVEAELESVATFELASDGEARSWHELSLELPVGPSTYFVLRTRSDGPPTRRAIGWWGPLALERDEAGPSVLLITADTLRADHVGAYGAEGVATPTLDALAERGTLFTDALTVVNSTSPSHASILTGLYPKDHGVLGNRDLLGDAAHTLAELMHASGRATLASVSVGHLAAASGLGQGFDTYLETAGGHLERAADDVNGGFRTSLDSLGERAFFAWLHYFDPHTPYEPENAELLWRAAGGRRDDLGALRSLVRGLEEVNPGVRRGRGPDGEPFERSDAELEELFLQARRFLGFLEGAPDLELGRALYRAEVEELDRDLETLFALLEERGRLDDTLVVFTADHGESLGERDIWFGHPGVYDNTLHVPLILAGPGVPAGLSSATPASTLDVVPTLCELLDLAPPALLRGISLAPALDGKGPTERQRWFQHSGGVEAGFRTAERHFILTTALHRRGTLGQRVTEGTAELFDRTRDPDLLEELSADPRFEAEARSAAQAVEAWLADRARIEGSGARALSAAEERALEDLGYTGD